MTLAKLNMPSEDTAIRAVIEAETRSFMVGDLDAWRDCWVQDSRTTEVMAEPSIGLVVHRGWDQIEAEVHGAIISGNLCDMVGFEKLNYRIEVDGDLAWATYDAVTHHSDGRISENFETRILERHGPKWRIVYCSFSRKRSSKASDERITVDEKGRVVDLEDGARERLRQHPGLTISHGQLRAERPAWDKALQDALRRAAGLHGYFDQFGYIHKTGSAFRCPVVLGEDDDGGIVTCIVEVKDGLTVVDIGTDAEVEARLLRAAAIFGLSPAQTDIAREIVAGHSTTEAARRLGITPATARTHLTRVFDKTGVNGQAALVRVLLSVG